MGWKRGDARAELRAEIAVLNDEIAALREQNVHLRLERQRPLVPGRAAERVRSLTRSVGATPEASPDDAWQLMTDAVALREGLLVLCRDLMACVQLVERRLSSSVPFAELERRSEPGDLDLRNSDPSSNGTHPTPERRVGA